MALLTEERTRVRKRKEAILSERAKEGHAARRDRIRSSTRYLTKATADLALDERITKEIGISPPDPPILNPYFALMDAGQLMPDKLEGLLAVDTEALLRSSISKHPNNNNLEAALSSVKHASYSLRKSACQFLLYRSKLTEYNLRAAAFSDHSDLMKSFIQEWAEDLALHRFAWNFKAKQLRGQQT